MINKNLRALGFLFLGFAILFLITSYIWSINSETLITKTFSLAEENTVKLDVPGKNTVYKISAKQSFTISGSSNAVKVQILDKDKNFLFDFGEEFYYETGRDYEGSWTEKNNSFHMSITIPEKGIHYLKLIAENEDSIKTYPVQLTVKKLAGSYIPFFICGMVILAIGIILLVAAYKNLFLDGYAAKSNDKSVSKIALIVLTIILAIIYIACFPLSDKGYGYAGYGGYQRRASIFYFGGPRYYSNPSVRSGSISGSNISGRGPGSGK